VRMLDKSDGPILDVLDANRKLSFINSASVERSNAEAYLKDSQSMHEIADQIARAAGESSSRGLT
jgi:hypothetical protein